MTRSAPMRSRPPAHALPPAEGRALALRLLGAEGFVLVASAARGDSFYLQKGDADAMVRVSGHARTRKRRRQYPHPTLGILIDRPLSEAAIRARVAEAVRGHARALTPR